MMVICHVCAASNGQGGSTAAVDRTAEYRQAGDAHAWAAVQAASRGDETATAPMADVQPTAARAIARRSVSEASAPKHYVAVDGAAIDRLRQALDGLHWVDITAVPLLVDKPSHALAAVQAHAGVRCATIAPRGGNGEVADKPYGAFVLHTDEAKAHAMLDQAALLYGIARRARRGHPAPAQTEEAATALHALRVDFARALSEESIRDKLFSTPLSADKYQRYFATAEAHVMLTPNAQKRLKAKIDIFHNGRTLPGVQGKNARDLAQSRYVQLFLQDYWKQCAIPDNGARLVLDWLDERKLSTDFAFGTGRHAIASVMRAATGRQYAESEQAELLAAFSSLALEESALGGVPPSVRRAARHLAEARGHTAVQDDGSPVAIKAEIDALMESLRAEMGPTPSEFDHRAAGLAILAAATGLDHATLQNPQGKDNAPTRPSAIALGVGGYRLRERPRAPSTLDLFLGQASKGSDYSAYSEARAAELRAVPDFFCTGAAGQRVGLNAQAKMDETRTRYNEALRSHPWTIAKAKDDLRCARLALTDEALARRIAELVQQYQTPLSEEQAAARRRLVLPAIPGIGVLAAVAYGVEDLVRQGDPTALLYAVPPISAVAMVVGGLHDIATGDHAEGVRKLTRVVPIVGELNEARHYASDGDVEMAILMVANAVVVAAPSIKPRFIPESMSGAFRSRLAVFSSTVRAAAFDPPRSAAVVHAADRRPSLFTRSFKNRVAPYRPGSNARAATAPRPGAASRSLRLDARIQPVQLPEDISLPDAVGVRRAPACELDQGYVEIDGKGYAAYRMHGRWHVERLDAEWGMSRLVPLVRDGDAWRIKTRREDLAWAAGLEKLFKVDDASAFARADEQPPAGAAALGREPGDDVVPPGGRKDARSSLLKAASSAEFSVQKAQRLVGEHPVSRFADPDKGFVYRGFVFRGDTRPYAEIFEQGFQLREAITDIREVNGFRGGFGGGADATDLDGKGISTSPFYDRDNAGAYYYGGHRGGYTYLVDARTLEGYDLYRNRQHVLGGYADLPNAVSPRPWEVNYGAAIPPERIVGAFDAEGAYFPNPKFRV
jgi:hypothetical protein